MSEYILEMSNISKSFHGMKALNDVSLKIRRGEVHALMGENGAGKSTLMKILTGLIRQDSGEIIFNQQKVHITNPHSALNLGIAMIHQELNPVPEMTIAENIFLGREPLYPGTPFINKRLLFNQTMELLDEFNLSVDPKSKVGHLSVAQKQMMEIIKAFSYKSKLIIMDEPTSALSDEEVKTLFKTIDKLKQKDVPVIYISHRMEEIFKITDSVTVLRDGEYVGTKETRQITKDDLITMMVGRSLNMMFPKEDATFGKTVLEVKNLTRRNDFEDISFKVREGEILGVTGLMGAGRSEVMRAIFGIDRLDAGEIWLNGKRLHIKTPSHAIANGLAMVTEDRKDLGLILCRSIKENMTLASLSKISNGPFVSKKREVRVCDDMVRDIRIKLSHIQQDVESLSGGNQQKVVLAKWLVTKPKLLILDEPTRGIDVGAKTEIYKMISAFAKEGLAIIMISSEMPEIMGMSDRILVMGEGRIKGEFLKNQVTQEEILKTAIGGASIA
jgi:ABC-type sugar transport system ATPase subunit